MQSGFVFPNKKFHAPANRANRERNEKKHRITDLPDSDHIKACHLNARSIRNKFLDLKELAATDKFDIIAITESWLNTKDRDFVAEYILPGYSIFSCDRDNRAGGAVIFMLTIVFTMR